MPPRRVTGVTGATVAVAVGRALAATAALALTLCACGDESGLRSAGATPAAVGPVTLWPGLPSVSPPPLDLGESDRRRVPGIEVAHGSVDALDPVAVVRAETAGRPADDLGPDGLPRATSAALAHCERGGQGLGEPASCPVLQAYRRDLTGDGRSELIVGVRLPGRQLSVRCYLAENGGLTRIMSTSGPVTGVELAGHELILRVVAGDLPGYAYRTTWSWDHRQGTMLPTRDEIIPDPADGEGRSGPARHPSAVPRARSAPPTAGPGSGAMVTPDPGPESRLPVRPAPGPGATPPVTPAHPAAP
ncbi:hypothetical protein [Streptomyces sp. NPDC059092]|uniref:hypothetical protein n=1 Tax=Streptomyces sp. NPDC059092 TaxID=3346725 RepID=UPI0036844620